MTNYEIFTEEPSAEEFFERFVPRLGVDTERVQIRSFRGKQDLKRKLPERLEAYSSFIDDLSYDFVIIVTIDQDEDDCRELKRELMDTVSDVGLDEHVQVRIVVKELESWYLGDPDALREAFQRIPDSFEYRSTYREPETMDRKPSEALEQLLKSSGYESGLQKIAAAKEMGETIDTDGTNECRSFHVFRETFDEVSTR